MDAVWRVLRDLKQPVPDAEDGILGHCHGLPQGKPRRAHLCEPPGLTVWRGNYDHDVHEQRSDSANLPLLKIPSLSSPRTNANNWKTRFQTVENTFAACIEQICSAALDRRAIGCNEYADPEKQLPWLARQLERNTPKVQEKPAKDKKLFVFAWARSWKNHLDENILSFASALLWEYEYCLSRIRACRALTKGQQ